MATLYVIPNWDRDFENSKSRQIERTSFFCVQNHFDGKKIRRLARLKRGAEFYGAFHAIAAVASKCLCRGVLLDDDGPIDARGLSDRTGFEEQIFVAALQILSKPEVGLLEKHEIEKNGDGWHLPGTVDAWAIPSDRRRSRKDATASPSDRGGTPSDAESQKWDHHSTGDRGGTPSDATESPSDRRGTPSDTERLEEKEEKGREEKEPPPVPQGGQAIESDGLISDAEEAKRRICKLILKGKNPARPWSHEAQVGLADQLPIPLAEIQLVAWFHRLPPDEAIHELKVRRQSEGPLMQNWSDEVTRATAYRKKIGADKMPSAKKEPGLWREFFRWKYGKEINLPAAFGLLGADQRAEWDRGHEEFESSRAAEVAT